MPINGTPDDDELLGTPGSDEIIGSGGDDTIRARAGDDVVDAGSGDDYVEGGAGNDEIDGGSGDDDLRGGAGNDVIDGDEGDDNIVGGAGNDTLNGGEGDDFISGGSGADLINGGEGDDTLEGGNGPDRFVFSDDFGVDTIADFARNDRIDLTAFTSYEISQDGDNVVIRTAGGTIIVEDTTVQEVAARVEVACLTQGTLVRTPQGEVAVETIAIGDLVTTQDGAAVPVKWIGKRSYSSSFLKANENIVPVLIPAGSLDGDVPRRDLIVSPEHGVLVGDVLVPAGLLVDGEVIRKARGLEAVQYFHLEFEEHQIILAEGTPTESYIDLGNRRMFENFAEYAELYGMDAADMPMQRRFTIVTEGPALERVRSRLAAQTRKAA